MNRNPLPLSEAGLQQQICELAAMLGVSTMHVRRSIKGENGGWATATSISGWPDLVLWAPGHHVLYRELKSNTGRLSTEQLSVLASLEAAGADVGVWRPKDWPEIESTLRRMRI